MIRAQWSGTAVFACVLAAGCGGAVRQSPAPMAPTVTQPAETQPSTAAPAPAGEGERPTPAAGSSPPRGWDDLAAELGAAEADALASGKDCVTACRALQSMQRSADGICSLCSETDDRCKAARERVRVAAEKVSGTCGGCPSTGVDGH
jgi:hypothetical protein